MAGSWRRIAAAALLLGSCVAAVAQVGASKCWVFAGFKGRSEEGVFFAISDDGYHWKTTNGGKAVLPPGEADELMRDPFLQRAPDGTFRMVWTWSWAGKTIGSSTSKDLVKWSAQTQLAVMANEPTVGNVWAPAIYWEAGEKRWLLFWSSDIPGRFAGANPGNGNHRIYSTTTKDFVGFTPAKVFFDPGYSVIDATLLATPELKGGGYRLMFKDERLTPLKKWLQTAEGPGIEGPWTKVSAPISESWNEGAAVIKVAGGYMAYYDHYRSPQRYGALFSKDFVTWEDANGKIDFPGGMRHGSFLEITRVEYERLAAVK